VFILFDNHPLAGDLFKGLVNAEFSLTRCSLPLLSRPRLWRPRRRLVIRILTFNSPGAVLVFTSVRWALVSPEGQGRTTGARAGAVVLPDIILVPTAVAAGPTEFPDFASRRAKKGPADFCGGAGITAVAVAYFAASRAATAGSCGRTACNASAAAFSFLAVTSTRTSIGLASSLERLRVGMPMA
jgi:hypothetical protein